MQKAAEFDHIRIDVNLIKCIFFECPHFILMLKGTEFEVTDGEPVNCYPLIQLWCCSVVVDHALTSWPKYN